MAQRGKTRAGKEGEKCRADKRARDASSPLCVCVYIWVGIPLFYTTHGDLQPPRGAKFEKFSKRASSIVQGAPRESRGSLCGGG